MRTGDAMLREIEVGLLSALVKSAPLARHLLKTGLRPEIFPSAEGREMARLILRVRDGVGDVTGAVEDQIAEAANLGAEGARLLRAVQDVPCPEREQALAYLALFDLTETANRCQPVSAEAAEAQRQRSAARQEQAPGAALHSLRRVHLPDPTTPLPGQPPNGQTPQAE